MQELQPDEVLVQKARQGSPEAFDALVLRYQYKAVALANSILRNEEWAKDASQNAFAKAYFAIKSFKQDAQFKTWLFRIIINEAKDTLRKERSRGFFKTQSEAGNSEDMTPILELIPSGARSPQQELEAREAKAKLEWAIHKLPEREREVFILRYLNDLSLNEIAETLNLAVGSVKAHLSHGLEKVKATIVRESEESISHSLRLSRAEGR